MTLALLPYPRFRATSDDGFPLAGGFLYSYLANSSTPQALLLSDGSTAAENPIELDDQGEADIRLGPLAYKLVLKTSAGVELWTVDHVSGLSPTVLDDYSNTLAQMRLQTDPGEVGSESLATSQAGEVERLRYAVYDAKAAIDPSITYWYETPYGFPVCNVEAYGADPTGVADSTAAFTAAIAAAAAPGAVVYGKGDFSLSTITITNGIPAFIIDGWLLDQGANANIVTNESATFPVGVVCTEGPNIGGGTVVSNLLIKCKVDITNGCRAGIVMDGGFNSIIDQTYVLGPADTAVGQVGILLNAGCGNIVVRHSTVFFPSDDPTEFQEGITGWGTTPTTENYYTLHGYDNLPEVDNPLSNIRLLGNDLIGGSHGVIFFGAQDVEVVGNRIHNHRDRGCEFFVQCTNVLVSSNIITNFHSAAVTSGCGMNNLKVIGNTCITANGNGEAVIQCYLGGRNITVEHNYLECLAGNTVGHGVYLGCDIQGAHIHGNVIKNTRVAAIAVDSDWKAGNVVGTPALFYGRVNSIAPSYAATDDAFDDTFDITITQNAIYNGHNAYGSLAGISLNQVKTRELYNVQISGNAVMGNNMLYYLALYEETSGLLTGIKYLHNSSKFVAQASFGFSRNMAHFEAFDFNDFNSQLQLTATTTTPSVLCNIKRVTCSSAGLITNFANGLAAQVITVRLDNASGIQNNANIYLRGGADIAVGAATSNYLVTLVYTGGKWFETARNF